MTTNSFAKLLKEARERNKLTQKELAEKVGLDDSYISRIERGVYDPPARDKVLALADALQITKKNERVRFLLAAGSAKTEDLEGIGEEESLDGEDLGIMEEAFFFPTEEDLEAEVLAEQVKQLVKNPKLAQDEREEMVKLIQSFLNWVSFRQRERELEEEKEDAPT